MDNNNNGSSNGVYDITSRDYLRVLFRHKGVILTTILTVMTMVIVTVLLRTPVYQSHVKMLISGEKQSQTEYYTDIGVTGMRNTQVTLTQSEIVSSDPVIERAVAALKLAQKPLDSEKKYASIVKQPLVDLWARNTEKKLETLSKEQKDGFLFRFAVENLRNRLDVDPVRDTDLFLIKVTDFNPVEAAVTANVVSRSYVMFDLEQQLAEIQLKYGDKNLSVIQLKEAIAKMSTGLNGAPLPALEAIGPATVKIIEQARVPLKPAGIPRSLTVILAFFISVFLGVILAFGFEHLDQTVRSPHEIQSSLGVEYLGFLPRKVRTDNYRELSENFYILNKDKGIKSLLFTSAMPREGVTPTIANLGIYFAENLKKKVLLIDGNLRTPMLNKIFRLPEANNLLDVCEGRLSLEKGVKSISPNLHILTAGSPAGPSVGKMTKLKMFFTREKNRSTPLFSPLSILESPMMKDLIKQASAVYDLVLIDSAPLGKVRDSAIISALTDYTVILVKEGKTRRHVIKHALDPLKARKTNILGAILYGRTFAIPKAIYDRM